MGEEVEAAEVGAPPATRGARMEGDSSRTQQNTCTDLLNSKLDTNIRFLLWHIFPNLKKRLF